MNSEELRLQKNSKKKEKMWREETDPLTKLFASRLKKSSNKRFSCTPALNEDDPKFSYLTRCKFEVKASLKESKKRIIFYTTTLVRFCLNLHSSSGFGCLSIIVVFMSLSIFS